MGRWKIAAIVGGLGISLSLGCGDDDTPSFDASIGADSSSTPDGGASADTSSDTTTITGDPFNGGLAWGKWWEESAGGSGDLPTGVDSAKGDFLRCKACHGWDAMGKSGGYVRRSANADRPAPNDSADLSNKLGSVTASAVQNSGGRAFTTYDDTHPDFSAAGGLTDQQVADLVAYLNQGPKIQDVATLDTTQDPVGYTFTGADTSAGDTLYAANCAGCHGTDGKQISSAILGDYFSSDGKYSEGFHKIMYGDGGSQMTRANQGDLTPEQARDILAYIQANIGGTFPTD